MSNVIEVSGGNFEGIITVHKGTCVDNMEHVSTFPNMILDSGLREIASNSSYMYYCNVGSSNTPVTAVQTSLGNRLHYSYANGPGNGATGADNSDPENRFIFRRRVVRFNPTGSAYNVSEIGFGWNTTGSLFNRALVLDTNGNPTTISVLENEYLDITYEVRLYPPTQIFSGTFTPTGKDTQTRTWTACAAGNGGLVNYDSSAGWSLEGNFKFINSYSNLRVSNGPMGNPFYDLNTGSGIQLGYSSNSTAGVLDSVENKIYYTAYFGLDVANFINGIKSVHFGTGGPRIKMEFDIPFMKTNTDDISITIAYSWGRK